MNLLLECLKFLIYSTLIVLISKYILVKILRKIGKLLSLKPKIIGNIAGIATSIPEFLTVSFSAFAGLMATSTYNIISSNIINSIQYGTSVVLNKNQRILKNGAIKIDLWLVGITILIPILMILFHIENSLVLVPIFIVCLFLFYKISNNAHKVYMKKEVQEKQQEIKEAGRITIEKNKKEIIIRVMLQVLLLLLVGILLYVIGNRLSEVLENLCYQFNVPEMIVGVLLGFITSLPELITFFESQRHHDNEKEGVVEATSNLLTSNMMNLFVVQAVGIVIYLMSQ